MSICTFIYLFLFKKIWIARNEFDWVKKVYQMCMCNRMNFILLLLTSKSINNNICDRYNWTFAKWKDDINIKRFAQSFFVWGSMIAIKYDALTQACDNKVIVMLFILFVFFLLSFEINLYDPQRFSQYSDYCISFCVCVWVFFPECNTK